MLSPRILCTAVLFWSTAAQALAGVATGDSEWRSDGEQIYQNYCASCHGAKGEGMPDWQQPNAQGELPAPPHGPEGHTWKHSDAMLYRIVHDGWRDPFNKTKRLTMPAFGDRLRSIEIEAVVNYLKTLWTEEQRQFQEEESKGAPN